MRGFDKLEEGRSRVLVYQVGSIQIIYQDVIRWLYQVDCQMDPYQILVDVSRVYWIHVYLRWIHVYLSGSQLDPCVSSWILVYLSRAFIDLSISITRSLQILVDLQYIHLYLYIPTLSLSIHSIPINPLYPYQSTLIHSYPPYPSILYLLISILCNRSILPSSSRHY